MDINNCLLHCICHTHIGVHCNTAPVSFTYYDTNTTIIFTYEVTVLL